MSEPRPQFGLKGVVDGAAANWPLAVGRHRVGRGSDNEIQLVDRSVSREHAVVLVENGRIDVKDLGSRNGTWVNGRRIEGNLGAKAGDLLRFGSVELELFGEGAAAAKTASVTLSDAQHLNTTMRLSAEQAIATPAAASSNLDRGLLQALNEAGHLLALSQPLEQLLDSVLEIVERVVPAKRIVILMSEPGAKDLVLRASRPRSRAAGERLMLSRTLIRTVVEERTSLLVTDAQNDPRFREHQSIVDMNLRSALVAPLFDNENVIGLIYTDTTDPLVRYDQDQLRAFTTLANLIAVKITNAKLLEDQREKERMEQELATAAGIQRSLLPSEFPCGPGYELLARQIPCLEVGGDLYDVAELSDGHVGFVLGDVSGKGMGAALLMSHVMASLRVLYGDNLDIKSLVGRVHRQLLRSSESMRFVTLFFGRLDQATHRLEYVSAGHNPAFLLVAGGDVVRLESTGAPLGLIDGSTYETGSVTMPPGALLCVYSDGVTEAQVGDEFFDEERLIESLARHRDRPLGDVADGVLDDVQAFLGQDSPGDDVTLLLVRRR